MGFACAGFIVAARQSGSAGPSGGVQPTSEPDLSGYSRYAWHEEQPLIENVANHVRFINAVQKEMKALGYRIDTVRPQAFIQYRAERVKGVKTRSTQKPSPWDPTDLKVQIDISREVHADVSLELVDAESGFLLWQVKGTYPVGTPDKAEKLIQAAVADLFSKYPRPEKATRKTPAPQI